LFLAARFPEVFMARKKANSADFFIREAREDDLPVLVEFLAKLALHVSGAPRRTSWNN